MKAHNRNYSSVRKEKDAKIAAERAAQKAELEAWNKNLTYKPSVGDNNPFADEELNMKKALEA